MKKVLAIILSVMVVMSIGMICTAAADNTADIYVTIADKDGKTVVAAEKITVNDADSDGTLTINDALIVAHDKFYEGGSAAGYATSFTEQYGLSLQKLWGTANGGSYGYYVNNASAWSLTDPVKDGDYLAAYIYTDLVGFSDNYSYFDSFAGDITASDGVTLTYTQAGYDEKWNPVFLPIEGAVITVDGEATEFKTDSEGKVTVKIAENGKHIISATVADKRLVAPVYIATVSGGVDPTQAPTQAPTTAPKNTSTVKTGSNSTAVYILIFGMLLAAAVLVIAKSKKYEK